MGRKRNKLISAKRRLQRSILRKYGKNKKGGSYCKTGSIIKSEKELLKLNHILDEEQAFIQSSTTTGVL